MKFNLVSAFVFGLSVTPIFASQDQVVPDVSGLFPSLTQNRPVAKEVGDQMVPNIDNPTERLLGK